VEKSGLKAEKSIKKCKSAQKKKPGSNIEKVGAS